MKILIIGNSERAENLRLATEGKRMGHDVKVVSIGDIVFEMNPKLRALIDEQDLCEIFDVVYIRNFFPLISEGLMLAELAATANLRVVDHSLATKNYIQSKTYQAWKLGRLGITMPRGFQTADQKEIEKRISDLKFPLVVKGVHGSQGTHVHLCQNKKDVNNLLKTQEDGFFSFQEFLNIKDEYRILVLGWRTLGVIRKIAPANDFRHNISLGGIAEPAELPNKLLKLCERAAKALDFEFAGVDLAITSDGQAIILEVNRSPGFIGFETGTGMNVAGKVIEYLVKK